MDEVLRVFGSRLARRVGLAFNARRRSTPDAALDELRRQVDELDASRARVVAAADARTPPDRARPPRRRPAAPRRARRQPPAGTRSSPTPIRLLRRRCSRRSGSDVREALESVRELAHGIYPPLLLDRGLAEALRAAASGAGIPARVEAAGSSRYPPEVEATVYFCCLEALQNAAAHAGAGTRARPSAPGTSRVRSSSRSSTTAPGFEQRADAPGCGSDQHGRPPRRTRRSAHASRSEPGGGTRVSGTIPLAP